MNTSDWLLEHVEDSHVALVEGGTSHSYGELKAAVAAVALRLVECGLEPGAKVGILGPNSLFWVASYLAVLKLGLVAVPFSLMLTPADARRNSLFATCSAILMDRRQRRVFGTAFPSDIRILYDDILAEAVTPAWPSVVAESLGDAAFMFTSGTTAAPKAVRVTHGNIQANTESIIEYLGLRSDDCMLVILPFYYCYGTSLLHTHLRTGARLVLCNNFTFPETALDLMERERCTGFAGVPSSFQLLLRISTFKARNLPSLRLIQQAGGKLHGILIEELAASKPSAKVYVMYGQTEATARLSYLPPDELHSRLGSVGKGIPGVSLRVVGEDGLLVAPGLVGEIRACGRNISPGYYNDPVATAEKFKDGELRTGDLATVDEDGYIYVVDRKDDFIKSWGYRISSQEIESGVLCLSDVVSAAAVGVQDIEAGEAIHVFITVRPGASLTPGQVLDHCRGRFAKYMVPSDIRIIPSLPLNSNGKVLKSELRKMALA
jgi:acyl-CoA synthetase (AMP-forming)/AMP-acid ligase II